MNPLAALSVVLLLGRLPAQEALQPQFVPGDATQLVCRVVAAEGRDEFVQLLTIEVQNKGQVAAEPLVFRVELPPKKGAPQVELFARAQLPHVARFGRPVPAGGKQTYTVRTRLPGKKAQFALRVEQAVFVAGGEVPKPAITIGTPEQVQRESLVGRFPVTQVTLSNPLAHEVDVLLRVVFEQPRDGTDLVGVRLGSGASQELVLATLPGDTPYLDPLMQAPANTVKAVRFEVVDWILVGAASPDAAAAVLRPAYEAWYRWPGEDLATSGTFVFRERMQKAGGGGYNDRVVEGRFELRGENACSVAITSGGGANAEFLLREAFANVRRPDFATFGRENRLALVTPDRVAFAGPGHARDGGDAAKHSVGGKVRAEECDDFEVRGGTIVSSGRGDGERTLWEMRDQGGARVVVRRHSRSVDTRFAYCVVDGLVVPSEVSSVTQFGAEPFSIAELRLANVRFGEAGRIVPAAPVGDGVAALRALWDAAYRLPEDPITIEAKFTATVGNDGVWRGHDKISGTVVMQGIGRHLRASDWTFDGKLARADEVQLAAVLRDRLGIWYPRDFNDRAPFDEFFRGATVHGADVEGTFTIDGGPVDRVLTQGGLVRGFVRGGSVTRFAYGKVGDRQVVTRIDEQIGGPEVPAGQRWNAVTNVTLQPIGGHLLPVRLAFERIFGRDWQAETIVFRDLKVR